MGDTLDDIRYDMYLKDLYDSYNGSLEKFASSKNVKELKENLEELRNTRVSIEIGMSNLKDDDLESLDRALREISTIDKVYTTLILESKRNKIYFVVGIILAIIGILLSVGPFFS